VGIAAWCFCKLLKYCSSRLSIWFKIGVQLFFSVQPLLIESAYCHLSLESFARSTHPSNNQSNRGINVGATLNASLGPIWLIGRLADWLVECLADFHFVSWRSWSSVCIALRSPTHSEKLALNFRPQKRVPPRQR